jgi:hypothetical protein
MGGLIGLLAPPIRRRDATATLNVALPVSAIIGDLARLVPSINGSSVSMDKDTDRSTALVADELKSLVLISLSSTWASGVIISPQGYVITSAHVFKSMVEEKSPSLQPHLKEATPPIRVRLHGQFDEWYPAKLVFISTSYIDVAVIKFSPPSSLRPVSCFLNPLPEPIKVSERGTPIFVLGHGLFVPYQRLPPYVSRGIISKVVYHRGEPVILESSAQVHGGASGGMLIHAETGDFLGLVTSNTQSRDGVTYSTLNNSILGIHLHDPLFRFLEGHKEALLRFNELDEEREKLWQMKSIIDPSPISGRSEQSPSQFMTFVKKIVDDQSSSGPQFKSKL